MSPPATNPPPTPVAFDAVRWLVVGATAVFLFVVALHLLDRAFEQGPYTGLRSLAGVLLPVVVLGFTLLLRRRGLERTPGPAPLAGFALLMLLGVAVMAVLDFVYPGPGIPVAELVVSTALALLSLSSARFQQRAVLAQYCGFLTGVLGYIVVLGFPALG